jgi:hypothetical protein
LIINSKIVLGRVILLLIWGKLVLPVHQIELFKSLIVTNVLGLVILLSNIKWDGVVENVSNWVIVPRLARRNPRRFGGLNSANLPWRSAAVV